MGEGAAPGVTVPNDGRGGVFPDVVPLSALHADVFNGLAEVAQDGRRIAREARDEPTIVPQYLEWVDRTRLVLARWLPLPSVDHLLRTRTYWEIVQVDIYSVAGRALAWTELEEAAGRIYDIETELQLFWTYWRDFAIVIPDTNVIMSLLDPFDHVDWHALAHLPVDSRLRVTLLTVVVDELDGLKDRGHDKARKQARSALQRIEALLGGDPEYPPVLAGANARPGVGEVTFRLIGEDPRRERFHRADDEIVDRAARFWPLVGQQATVITNDTGMITRCRQFGVRACRHLPL